MEEFEKVFINVLEKDERILLSYRPNKLRMCLWTGFFGKLFLFILGLFLIIFGMVGYTSNPNPSEDIFSGIVISIVFGGILLLFCILYIILPLFIYKKTYYVVTNKKIIIRTGLIGVDYKTLDIKYIGSVNVNVNIYDKMMGSKCTGTISFASSSAPMVTNNQSSMVGFNFFAINNPYDTYKNIKELIEELKG